VAEPAAAPKPKWPSLQPHPKCAEAAEVLATIYLVFDNKRSATLDPDQQGRVDRQLMMSYERCYRYLLGCLLHCDKGGFTSCFFLHIMGDPENAHGSAVGRLGVEDRLHAGLTPAKLHGLCMSCGKDLCMNFDGRWRLRTGEHHKLCQELGGDFFGAGAGAGIARPLPPGPGAGAGAGTASAMPPGPGAGAGAGTARPLPPGPGAGAGAGTARPLPPGPGAGAGAGGAIAPEPTSPTAATLAPGAAAVTGVGQRATTRSRSRA